jgi:site-specific recombinase XerD
LVPIILLLATNLEALSMSLPVHLPGSDMLSQEVREDLEATVNYLAQEKAQATRRAYRADMRIFTAWCEARMLPALPARPETVAVFLASQAKDGVRAATLARRVAAIRDAHRAEGLQSPTGAEQVKATLRGIRRTIGTAQRKKSPATADRVIAMARQSPDTLRGFRDRALLLLGFAGAFRRSELAALTVADLEEVSEGLRVRLRRSKTDQEGAGRYVPIPRGSVACPVAAVRQWLEAARIVEGPVFRSLGKGGRVLASALSTRSIGLIVQRYAGLVGLDPKDFGGHSLRAGFLTSAAANGADLFRLMDQSGHRSVETVRGYVRRAEEFKDHAGAGLL